jgi:hypothetical protein
LPVPHSWHDLAANAGKCASIQQKIGLSRSSSQHGNKEDAVVGAAVGQSLPRLVPPMPPPEYDVPTEPTLTRGPHRPAMLFTKLQMIPTRPHSVELPTSQVEGARVNGDVVLSQLSHRRHLAELCRDASLQIGVVHPAADDQKRPRNQLIYPRLKWRERVSTGVVLSQLLHRRHQANLCRDASVQIVPGYAAADAPTLPHLVDTPTSQVEGARVVISQVLHRRHQAKLCRDASLQIVLVDLAANDPQATTFS